MNIKRIAGIVLIAIGVGLIGISHYIKGEVAGGQEKVSRAQRQVDTTNTLFSLSPASKGVGDRLTGSAQKKIDEGRQEILEYQTLSGQLQIGGLIAVVLGAVLVIFSRKKRG